MRENSNNYRSGYSDKKLIGANGNLEVKIPIEYNNAFVSHLVKMYEKDILEIKRKIVYVYSCENSIDKYILYEWNIWSRS